jgi:uncharacterized protein YdeI (YjbR/CyaY-like superfamily)
MRMEPMPKLKSAPKWRKEMDELKKIVLEFPLTEEVKWGWPCFSSDGANIVLIHGFKDYCALMFFKGSLLKDPKHILIQPTENMQVTRQIRFTSLAEVVAKKAIVKTYIKQAIEVEKSGVKPKYKKTSEFKVPEEFQKKLNEMPTLKTAFEALTPGRQRGYLFHFAGAKQSATRAARVEKYIPQILKGKGLMD